MIRIQNTKALRTAFQRYLESNDDDIFDVYKNPSQAKQEAFVRCWALCDDMNGDDFKIVSHNAQTFSVGFIAHIPSFDGMYRLHYIHITRDNLKALPLE